MSDFIAKVRAELDLTEAQQKLNKFTNQKYTVNMDIGDGKKSVNEFNKALQTTRKTANSLGDSLKKSLNIGASAAITAKGIQAITTVANNMTKSIKGIDKATMNLVMATNESYDAVSRLVSKYNEMGKALGATTTEVASSADAWLRQGKTIEETNTLIENSMMLSKIGQIDSADATEYLTAAMKGYGVEVQNVQNIVDKLCSVDLVSATNAAGLAEAMSRTAVTADMAGISMDRLLGYLATVGETTQKSMSSIGESFKTIFTRMSDIKAEKLELVDEDGTVETLSDVELTLQSVGINLRETVNEYNDYGEVLDNLADKWESLSEVQQNALAKAFAGTRQQENFRVLMENYDAAKKYMDTAADSAGTAEAKFGAYLESIEAKAKTLQATFESLAVNTVSTDMFGGIIEGTTAVVEFLDKTNLLKGTLAGLATVGTLKVFSVLALGIKDAALQMNDFNAALKITKTGNLASDEFAKLTTLTQNLSNSQLKAVLSTKALSTEQKVAILVSRGMSQAEAEATLTTMGLATAEGTASAATFSLSGALKGLWATLMANPLVLVAVGVTAAVSAFSSMKQKAEEAAQATLDTGESAKEAADNLIELYSAYESAKSTKDGLTEATDALLSALGLEESQIETLVEKYGDLDNAIQQVTIDSLQDKLADLTAGYDVAVDELLGKTKSTFLGGSFNKLSYRKVNGAYKEDPIETLLENAGINLIDEYSYNGGYTGSIIDLGDNTTLEGVIEMYDKLHKMRNLLNEEMGADELIDNELYSDINEKLSLFEDEYTSVMDYIAKINETSALIQLQEALQDNVPKTAEEFKDFKAEMIKTAKESGKFTGSQEDIENAINNTCKTLPELAAFYMDVETAVEGIEESTETAQQSIITLTSSVQSLLSGIQTVQEVLSSQSTGKSISLDDYNSDELTDYREAIEYVNGSMQLNAEKVAEIAKAKSEEELAVISSNKAYEQSKYLENAAEIEKLRKKLRNGTLAENESRESIEASIEAYSVQNDALLETINGYDVMSASIREATSAYQHWLNAQNAAQSGDMFDSSLEALKKINDTLNVEDSDSYGRIGNADYKAAVDFVVPESIDHEDTEAVNKYMDSIKDLFTYDEDGNRDGLDIMSFCEKAVDAGLMTLDESTDEFKVAGQTTMEDFANGLGLSLPLVQAMFGEMEEFGAEFDWSDEAVKTMGDLGVAANEAANELLSLEQYKDLAITLDVSDLATKEEKISSLDATIKEISDAKAKMDVDSSEYEYANSILEYCIAQKQLINQPDVMTVDTSMVEGKLGEAIGLLQEFQTAKDQLERAQTLGIDTTQAQANLDAVTQKIQGLDTNITTALNIDPTSIETITSTVSSLSCEMIVKAGVDESAVIGYQQSEHDAQGTVTWKNDTKAVDNYVASQKIATGQVKWYNNTSLVKTHFTATGSISWSGSSRNYVNGTAHAMGTAYAGGNWGTAPGGDTLVGELGQEIVVDPHTGRWYTVGDNGAEFANIPRGAIVFNHKQSQSLLENGYALGRATALASGTAMVSGGIKLSQAQKSTGSYKPPSSSSSKKTTSTKSSTTTKDTKKTTDDFKESFDWVEIALNRITEAIDRIKVKAESVFKTFTKRNNALADEVAYINAEIDLQQQAYDEYIAQANSVGLSSSWAEKVRNGAIDISTITNENLADQIKEYQEYYEKAIECKDAVAELHEEVASLYQEKFDNVATKWEGEIALLEHLTNSYNNGMDELEARGYMNSMKYYEALEKAEKQKQQALQKELTNLTKAYNEAMNSGEIEEGSQAYNEMQQAINSVKEELQGSNIELAEFAREMRELDWSYFDYIRERISDITDESEFLIDLLAGSDLFDDNGNLTENGLATMGLHAQNHNVYMNQADQYGAEAAALEAEIEADPYNQDLIERREELLELQRESILAAEQEEQAIVDLVEDGINIQLDALKELINTYTESLDSAKDLYEYQKKVKEQTTNIANLQKQLSAYSGDNSEENRARIQKLQVDLSEAMEDLQETQYDQYITDQKKLLDNLYLEYETILNERLDNVDALLTDVFDAINSNSATIDTTIRTESGNVGYTISESLKSIWSNEGGATSIITKYGEGFTTQLTSVNEAVRAIAIKTGAMVDESNKEAEKTVQETTKTTPTTTTPKTETPKKTTTTPKTTGTQGDGKLQVGDKVTFKSGKYYYSPDGQTPTGSKYQGKQVYITKINTASWATKPYHISTGKKLGSGDLGWLTKSQLSGYATGLKYANKDEDAWVNELGSESIINPTGSAIVTHVAKGSTILDAQATKNIWDMANDPSDFISGNLFPNSEILGTGNNVGSVDITMQNEFNLPGVSNYNEFVTGLQKDPKFEKMVQSMTIDRLFGGSKLSKHKYKWN